MISTNQACNILPLTSIASQSPGFTLSICTLLIAKSNKLRYSYPIILCYKRPSYTLRILQYIYVRYKIEYTVHSEKWGGHTQFINVDILCLSDSEQSVIGWSRETLLKTEFLEGKAKFQLSTGLTPHTAHNLATMACYSHIGCR